MQAYGIETWGNSSVAQINRVDSKNKWQGTYTKRNLYQTKHHALTHCMSKISVMLVFKYYRLKHGLHCYRIFDIQELRHYYNTIFSSDKNVNMFQIHSSKNMC